MRCEVQLPQLALQHQAPTPSFAALRPSAAAPAIAAERQPAASAECAWHPEAGPDAPLMSEAALPAVTLVSRASAALPANLLAWLLL